MVFLALVATVRVHSLLEIESFSNSQASVVKEDQPIASDSVYQKIQRRTEVFVEKGHVSMAKTTFIFSEFPILILDLLQYNKEEQIEDNCQNDFAKLCLH